MWNETSNCHKCDKTDVSFSLAPHGRTDRLLFLLVFTDMHVIKVGPMETPQTSGRRALCLNFIGIVGLCFVEFCEVAGPVSVITANKAPKSFTHVVVRLILAFMHKEHSLTCSLCRKLLNKKKTIEYKNYSTVVFSFFFCSPWNTWDKSEAYLFLYKMTDLTLVSLLVGGSNWSTVQIITAHVKPRRPYKYQAELSKRESENTALKGALSLGEAHLWCQ